jgi:hypothetical protein
MSDDADQLPEGWAVTTLKDFAVMRLGKMLDAAKQTSGRQHPYLRNLRNINVRWFEFNTDNLQTMALSPAKKQNLNCDALPSLHKFSSGRKDRLL